MKTNFLEKLSLLKLTGKTRYLLINVYHEQVSITYLKKNENPLKVTISPLIPNYKILDRCVYRHEGDYNLISNFLNKFIHKNRIKDAVGIIGINDFKLHSIKLTDDVEDSDSWFSENSSRFLPEGCLADEFIYSYEKYYDDEDSVFYRVGVTRKNFIEEILKVCSAQELNILGIYPFSLSIAQYESTIDENTLFIDLLSSKVQFLCSVYPGQSYFGEIYMELSQDKEDCEDYHHIQSCIKDIKGAILTWLNTQDVTINKLYINCAAEEFAEIKNISSEIFNVPVINNIFENEETTIISTLFTFNKIINHYDSGMNFLPEENRKNEKEKIEKYISLKLALASGFTIICLLLIANLFEGFIAGKIDDGEENLLTVNEQELRSNRLINENEMLKANLLLLQNLKGSKAKYSTLLLEITEIVNYNTCLLDLSIKKAGEKVIELDISGFSYSQQDVAEMIRRMESFNRFSNISLLNSAFVETKYINKSAKLNLKEVVQFKLTAEYNVN